MKNLPIYPKINPKSTQNRPKIDQKSIQSTKNRQIDPNRNWYRTDQRISKRNKVS